MKKQRWEESEKRRAEERRSEKRKSQAKEDAGARIGSKVAEHCVFPMICGSGGSKSRLAKAAGAEPCGQVRDEKVQAVVARSTIPSQNVQSTPTSDHFWKLRCQKKCMPKVSKTSGFCATTTTTLHYTPLHYTKLYSITLHHTALHHTTPHYATLHDTTPHHTTLHYIHYTTLH